eukprot:symbB.v1.2.009505.t1/scaffold590.1/size183855/17
MQICSDRLKLWPAEKGGHPSLMVVRQGERPFRRSQGVLCCCLALSALVISSRAFLAAPERVSSRSPAATHEHTNAAAQALLLASAAPEAAKAADSIDEALHPWFSISPYYGGLFYIILLVVQRLKWEWYPYVYVGAATLWLGPAVFLLFAYKFDAANQPLDMDI